jgi:hypothetical protein
MRIKGSVSVPTNYEPLVSGPFDARSLVQYKTDLFKDSTWRRKDGVSYIYNGMLVGVYKDSIENNGYYILQDKENRAGLARFSCVWGRPDSSMRGLMRESSTKSQLSLFVLPG